MKSSEEIQEEYSRQVEQSLYDFLIRDNSNPYSQQMSEKKLQQNLGKILGQHPFVSQKDQNDFIIVQKKTHDENNEGENILQVFRRNIQIQSHSQIQMIQDQPQFKNIFLPIKREKIRDKIRKNTNVVKHFIKKFIYGCLKKRYIKFFNEQPLILRELNTFIKKQKQMYQKEKNWNNNIQALIKIFGQANNSFNPQKRSRIMRNIANQMIHKQLIPQVFKNNQIKKQMTKCYLHTLKILSYRCNSHSLISRTQIL